MTFFQIPISMPHLFALTCVLKSGAYVCLSVRLWDGTDSLKIKSVTMKSDGHNLHYYLLPSRLTFVSY